MPEATAARFRATEDRLARYFGDGALATLERQHSLVDRVKGKPATQLQLDGAHVLGATTINLHLFRSAAEQGLSGTLPVSSALTIGATTYTTTAEASVPAGSAKLVVTIAAPGLLAGAADGTNVEVGDGVTYTYSAAARDVSYRDIMLGNGQVRAGDRWIDLSALGTSGPEPRTGDHVTFAGRRQKVVAWTSHKEGSGEVGWSVLAGAAR